MFASFNSSDYGISRFERSGRKIKCQNGLQENFRMSETKKRIKKRMGCVLLAVGWAERYRDCEAAALLSRVSKVRALML